MMEQFEPNYSEIASNILSDVRGMGVYKSYVDHALPNRFEHIDNIKSLMSGVGQPHGLELTPCLYDVAAVVVGKKPVASIEMDMLDDGERNIIMEMIAGKNIDVIPFRNSWHFTHKNNTPKHEEQLNEYSKMDSANARHSFYGQMMGYPKDVSDAFADSLAKRNKSPLNENEMQRKAEINRRSLDSVIGVDKRVEMGRQKSAGVNLKIATSFTSLLGGAIKNKLGLDVRFSMYHGTGSSMFVSWDNDLYEVRIQPGSKGGSSNSGGGAIQLLNAIQNCGIFDKTTQAGTGSFIGMYEPKLDSTVFPPPASPYAITVVHWKSSPYKSFFEQAKMQSVQKKPEESPKTACGNWYKTIKATLVKVANEYWIMGDGDIAYADGDVGDVNHERYVIRAA